jgi:protein lin-54
LKLYCECFAKGGYCGVDCGCIGCSNTEGNEDIVSTSRAKIIEKNPDAFNPKAVLVS